MHHYETTIYSSLRTTRVPVAVKTHDSLPLGADRLETQNGRESTAATNLPKRTVDASSTPPHWGSECPVAACPAGNSHEHFTPASKDGCTLLRAGRRLATDIWHSWVKQASPQSACLNPKS